MEHDSRLSLIVGGFVIASLAAFALAVVMLSSESGLFTPQYRLHAEFENVQGLLPGAPVWLAGREIGRVEDVRFSGDLERPVRVLLRVDRAVQSRIRADSVARIGTIGVLGDSYVEVSSGGPEAPALPEGARLDTVTPANLSEAIGKGTRALDAMADLAGNLNEVVMAFGAGGGGARAADAVNALSDITLEVRHGGGLLNSLIYDEYEGGGVESIERSLAILEDILDEIRNGQGILHTMIFESPTEQDLVMDFLAAGARLNSILDKVDRGEGTLGMLLNDPTLYEDLKTLVGGANRSLVVRSMVRLATEGEEAQ